MNMLHLPSLGGFHGHRRVFAAALLLLSAAMLPGCSSGGSTSRPRTAVTPSPGLTPVSRPAAAEYGVVSRELTVLERAAIDDIYEAAQRAMRDLELRVVDRTKDRLSASLAARTAHDERVTIGLGRVSSGITDVSIKVGFWGDEGKSRAILSEIRRQLAMSGVMPGDAAPGEPTIEGGIDGPESAPSMQASPTLATNIKPPTTSGARSGTSAPARGTSGGTPR
jgi:Protein of unknown function (DUF3568)